MRLVHLSDLHLGKRLCELSLIEDQKYILDKITEIISQNSVDVVLIAGDVYDKTVPSAEAVELFDSFLTSLSYLGVSVLIVSGNHDSAERLAFGGRLMSASGIYISPVYDGKIEPVTLRDEFGNVNFWLVPFLKPSSVRRYFEDEDIVSYDDAVRRVVDSLALDESERNVIVSHQFVTGALRSDSEEISVGGADNISLDIYNKFDYGALGHIHRPQRVGRDTLRYSGTPLKYSFSEAKHEKSVTVVDMLEKGRIELSYVSLVPMRDMAEIKGSFDKITSPEFYEGTKLTTDFLHITLTDDDEITDAIGKLRKIFRNVLKLDYDNTRTRLYAKVASADSVEVKSPFELFGELYEKQNNTCLNDEEREFMEKLILRLSSEEVLI